MLNSEEWKMIRELKQSGLTISEISKKLGVDRKTVRSNLSKNSIPKYQRKKSESILDAHKSYIDTRLEKYNLTSQRIFEELKTQGYSGQYGMVNKYAQNLKADYKIKATLRFETIPGEQAQVDWAYFGDFYDHDKKKLIRLCCFIMVLGFSRMRFIHFFASDDSHNFLTGHNLAFQFFGGYTREILYDNLKSVVLKRAFKQIDSEFNQEFIEFSGYYGFKAVLAQPYRPQTKGKVESTVRFVRENFFNGNEFKTISEVNQEAKIWLNKINNQVHHTTHEKPVERLGRENLIELIGKPYDLSKIYYRKVQMDYHFSFRANFYSCSPKFAGKEVVIREIDNHIFIYHRDERIGFHEIEEKFKGGYITSPSHYLEMKEITQKQSKLAWRNKKREREIKNSYKYEPKPEYQRTGFNSGQIIKLFQEVEKRDLNIYEEIIL
jgi:transposase